MIVKYENFPHRRIAMSATSNKRIHLLYGIVTGAAAILAGICLIAACLDIYVTGVSEGLPQIYTRQIVAEHFAKIAIPVYSCLALVIGGMVLNLALPLEKAKLKPEKNLPLILTRLREKTDLESCEEGLKSSMLRLQQLRKQVVCMAASLLVIGTILFLIYACNGSNWGSNSTPSMVSAMYMMLGCLTVPFLFTVYAASFCHKSTLAEIDLMKQASKQAPRQAASPVQARDCGKAMTILRVAVVAVAVALVILGACNEGTKDILTKAVNICTECVGLG